MTFAKFSRYLNVLEKTSSRLEMTAQLAELWRQLTYSEAHISAYLLQGILLPSYMSLEFQLSTKMVLRALSRLHDSVVPVPQAVGLFESDILAVAGDEESLALHGRYKALGDVGLVAEEVAAKFLLAVAKTDVQSELQIEEVYRRLVEIARVGGNGSQEKKLELLVGLFKQLDPISAKFVSRIIIGKLRLGFSTMTLMDSLSWSKWQDKRDGELLELAYQQKADIGKLAASYLNQDFSASSYTVEVGVPLVNALCQRLNTAAEIIAKMPEVYVEPKYDGLRIQIHIDKQGIFETDLSGEPTGRRPVYKAFTRNLEDVSNMFPELEKVVQQLTCQSCILDCEAVGIDPITKKITSFQTTITRKRKHDVAETAVTVPIRFFVFDLMYLDGRELISEPLSFRKTELQKICTNSEVIEQTKFIKTTNADEVHEYHSAQLAAGLEGAVIKLTSSEYRSGRKGWRWVKIKEHEGSSGKLNDTVDCVVMGYYRGRGKRTGFGVGAFLLGVIEEVDGELLVKSVAKLGTGLTDVELPTIKNLADQAKIESKPANYWVDKNLEPDVWVEPVIVLEIAADEITKSTIHQSGWSLRFPRLVRVRSDKNWQQATSVAELQTIEIAK